MTRTLALPLSLALLASVAACSNGSGGRPAIDTSPLSLDARYERVAARDDRGRPITPSRWSGDIRYALEGDAAWSAALDRQMATLAELTGLSVAPADPATANVAVVFKPRQAIEAELRTFGYRVGAGARAEVCLALVLGNSALVYIDTGLPAPVVQNCLVQETTQMLGLPGDLDDRADTVFSSYSMLAELSPEDRELVHRHFSTP